MHKFRKRWLCLAISIVAWSAGSALPAAPAPGPRPPNAVFLLADDLRADAVGALGRGVVKTPNLDGLAQSGFVFHHAYYLGGNSPAVCLPSRNMLLSGRAYFRWKGSYASADAPNFPVAPQINRSQRFDLQTDPDEQHDLSGEPAQRGRIEHLTGLMRDWQHRLGDTTPLESATPREARFVPPAGKALEKLKKDAGVK